MTTQSQTRELDAAYDLTEEQVRRFREEGFIKLKEVFHEATLARYREVITPAVLAHGPEKPVEERDTYGQAFIQVGNLWVKEEAARPFIFSRRLARLAMELMGAGGVRMYHDQALYKEAGGGFTPWHVDQQYWPLASAKTVTAWVPFHETPIDRGALCFGKGSHVKNIGHDLAISDESERRIREQVKEQGILEVQEPYDVGEVSFHTGWTLHRAGPNTSGQPREVQTVIYMDKDMRLAEPRNENQRNDREAWCPGAEVGRVIETGLNPVLYLSRGQGR